MTVPVIDISGDPRRVADEIGAACRELGFLTVTGHGVPEDVVERTARVARTFFDLPDQQKRTLADGEQQAGLPPTGRSGARAWPPVSAGRRRAT